MVALMIFRWVIFREISFGKFSLLIIKIPSSLLETRETKTKENEREGEVPPSEFEIIAPLPRFLVIQSIHSKLLSHLSV